MDKQSHLLELDRVSVGFPQKGRRVKVVTHGVSLYVDQGEALGIVGESGSGKSVSMLATLGLLGNGGRVVEGSIRFYQPGGLKNDSANETLRIWHCHCFGTGLTPGLGTYAWYRRGQKRKKKKKNFKTGIAEHPTSRLFMSEHRSCTLGYPTPLLFLTPSSPYSTIQTPCLTTMNAYILSKLPHTTQLSPQSHPLKPDQFHAVPALSFSPPPSHCLAQFA